MLHEHEDPAFVWRNPNNASELFRAVAKDDHEKVKKLVENGDMTLATTIDEDEQTAAHVAMHQGNFPLLVYFLEQDAGLVDARDMHGRTIMHIAAKKGDLNVMKHLVNVLKVDVRLPKNRFKNLNTPIHIATEEGHLHIVKWYIEEVNPFKPDLRNEDGETLLMSAAKKAHLPIVRYLIEHGYANPFLLDNYDANVLFHSAIIGDISVPKYLLDERTIKLDVDFKNMFGMTVVFMATRFHHLDFIKYFVEQKNAIIDIGNYFGWTPLHEAVDEGQLDIVKYLIEHKAGSGREDFHGDTPVKLSKDKKITVYLEGVAKQRLEGYDAWERSRGRRSVSELFVVPPPHLQTPLPCKWIKERILDRFPSASGEQPDIDSTSATLEGSLQLDGILMLAGACAKYIRKIGSPKHRSLLSPKEILHERIDPIAFDALDAMYDFEYPHMNNDWIE